jgi:hypothetical protein
VEIAELPRPRVADRAVQGLVITLLGVAFTYWPLLAVALVVGVVIGSLGGGNRRPGREVDDAAR